MYDIPLFRKHLMENTLLIMKFKVKYFHGYITSLKYFCLEHISLTIIQDHSRYCGGVIDCGKIINAKSYYAMIKQNKSPNS